MQGPKHLNFLKIHFPITAWVSIAHRASGFLLFLLIPVFLWVLERSLSGVAYFQQLKVCCTHPVWGTMLCLALTALVYHILAGLRHLFMDLHIGSSKSASRRSAQVVLMLSFLGFFYMVGRFLC